MATVSDGLYGRLSGYAGLATLVSTRIFPGMVPQGKPTPYIAFVRIDEDEDEAMQKNADIQETQFEVMSVGATYAEAEAVHEQVRDACRRFQGTANGVEIADMLLRGGEGPLYQDETQLYEATQQVAVRYRRPA